VVEYLTSQTKHQLNLSDQTESQRFQSHSLAREKSLPGELEAGLWEVAFSVSESSATIPGLGLRLDPNTVVNRCRDPLGAADANGRAVRDTSLARSSVARDRRVVSSLDKDVHGRRLLGHWQ